MRKFNALLPLLVSVSLLSGRQEQRTCSSHSDKWREELHLHRQSQIAEARTKRTLKNTARALPDAGNIAQLDEGDGVVSRRNAFNLAGRTIQFFPTNGRSYRYELGGGAYDASFAEAGTPLSGLGDDDSRELDLPFAFPFFGSQQRTMHVNSDGNLTFGIGDAAITDRSLGRFLSGAPRVAALFSDLDPTKSQNGVRVLNEPNRVVVSWADMPEFRDSGVGPLQTFQIRIYSDGKIEVAFAHATTPNAVTGISPGGSAPDPLLVSFLNGGGSGTSSAAIAERFSGSDSVDIFAAAQKFYQTHEDAYDYLVIYNTLGIAADDGAVAYEVTLRNQRSGYGDPKTDVGSQAGSKKRLQSILNMGPLRQYPKDPNGRVPARLSVGDTPLSILAHESGHLFLAYASVRDASGLRPLLGYQSAHWDFKFNSEASIMEGNRIQDNGAGASPRFLTTATVEGFSAWDQYLMGFLPAAEVPDSFYVSNTRNSAAAGLPRKGVAFDGERRDVSLRDLIAVEGRRTPDDTVAQRQFRFAFLLIGGNGAPPSAEGVVQLEAYRSQFEEYFHRVTASRATADTSLRKAVQLSVFPAAGVVQGQSGQVTLSLDQPPAAPVSFLLRSRTGGVQTPRTVEAPAGSQRVTFPVSGVTAGVDEITLEPADSSYETVVARLQVLPVEQLRLTATSESSPVRLKVTDSNELPYQGVTVAAQVFGGGSIDRASAISDADGLVEFRWNQPAAGGELKVRVLAGPSVTIAGAPKPAFAATGVLNAASFAPGLAPGGLATIFGARLGGAAARVTIGGKAASVFFGNDNQLNFIVPQDLAPGTAEVVIRSGNAASDPIQVSVLRLQPGIFFDVESGYGAVLKAGSGQLTQNAPVLPGDYIEVYATGLGAVRTSPLGLSETVAKMEVTIGGIAADVSYSGLSASYPGLYQLNVRVPAGLTAGRQSLVVRSEGLVSNQVKILTR